MESVLQDILVGVIVAGCAVFSAWRLMSPKLRLRVLDSVVPVLERLGAGGTMARLRSRTIAQLGAGCSACSPNKAAVHHPGARRSS
jgi:hypothetical protein